MFGIFDSLTGGQKKLAAFSAMVFSLAILSGVVAVFPSASNQGYYPDQPIPFSHKTHAGDYKIDCRYCHSSAAYSSHSPVPSMNVCMNCHKAVKTDSPHIQKLTKMYEAGEPIPWVRIHEVPDFVRFDHAVHIGHKIACQTCHGPVETMEKVYQYAPLTMGWCMNCHRGVTTPEHVIEEEIREHGEWHSAPIDCSTCHY